MVDFKIAQLADQTALEYALVLPDNFFDPEQHYPTLLTFPPGPQSHDMVAWGLNSYWLFEAQRRDWIVISPTTPDGVLFFEGAERLIPEFFAQVTTQYPPEGGKVHLAGISNGGISAFRIALNNPEPFHSITVLPGFPPTDQDVNRLATLKHLPVTMFVGEHDSDWVDKMVETEARLIEAGGQASLSVVPGEDHVIQSLGGGRELFDLLDSVRKS